MLYRLLLSTASNYILYFFGFDSITYDEPFNASLFVEIRKRMGMGM
jgi:hypothetical protein